MNFEQIIEHLKDNKYSWLVTGGAGFIGSHLTEFLLKNNQKVRILDNFATGYRENINEVIASVGDKDLEVIEGSIEDLEVCQKSCQGIDYVLHQAALGSVPRSIEDPLNTHSANVDGFINMLFAAKENLVKAFVYASSSSVYGDHPKLPKVEGEVGECLSPYAVSKKINELYSAVFYKNYGFNSIGIRYFNVFGPRQDPNGPYAAVIPLWLKKLVKGETVEVFGDGETSRDFCFVDNVVQMNILSALNMNNENSGKVFNCALGDRLTLNDLYKYLVEILEVKNAKIEYKDFRVGDVKHSQANIESARELVQFNPEVQVKDGLIQTCDFFKSRIDSF